MRWREWRREAYGRWGEAEWGRSIAASRVKTPSAQTDGSRGDTAVAHQALGVTVLLKGPRTVVAGPGIAIALEPATPWLATAGTGDVLAGIAGALVAGRHAQLQTKPALLAQLAATAAFLHAMAAALASDGAPLTAITLVDALGAALRQLLSGEGNSSGG